MKNKDPKVKTIDAQIDTSSKGYHGCIEEFKTEIRGWLLNAGSENEPLSVEIRIDGHRAATAYCVTPRADIESATGRPNTAGFKVPTRALVIPEHLLKADDTVEIELTFVIKETGDPISPLFRNRLTLGELRKIIGSKQKRALSKTEITEAVAPHIEAFRNCDNDEPEVRFIAFYLPQFHPIAENDEWWGPGFTEWTNVCQGKPQFPGHYQPHLPGELGFYDLRLPEVRDQQAQLAREHGIFGFCYYYYWFNGRKILERPLQEVLECGKPDLPFCICWANETWSRRWDGTENEVLLKQEHTPESDVAFIRDVIPILKDPRYIKVNGSPLLLVYRASLFPDLRTTADTWRRICEEEGISTIHLCIVESFGFEDPYSVGFDSSVQFPPHGVISRGINSEVDGLDSGFVGRIYDYSEVVSSEITRNNSLHKKFRGVMCSWDNTPRRKNKSHIFNNATPELYEIWLRSAREWTKKNHAPGERMVFINAWNEWAEGTHLEPDRKYGRAYLEATRRVASGKSDVAVLLDYAAKVGKLEGSELVNFLKEIKLHLDNSRLKTSYSQKIIERNHAIENTGSIFSEIEPYPLCSLPASNVAKFNVDRINGRHTSNKCAVAKKSMPLYIEGWAFHPGQDVYPTSISYVVLKSTTEKRNHENRRYYAPVFERHARPDVANANAHINESKTLYSGCRIYADLSDVEAGEYHLGMVQIAEESFSLNFFEGIIRVS